MPCADSPERWLASSARVTPATRAPASGRSAPSFVSAVTSPRSIAPAKSNPVNLFVIEPISYFGFFVRTEAGVGDGGPVHHGDADSVKCAWQERPGSSGEVDAAGDSRGQ